MMKLSEIFTFFLSSNIFVSICVVALCQSTAIILSVNINYLLPFVFFSSLFCYNFLRIIRFSYFFNQKEHGVKSMSKVNQYITIISLVFTIYFSRTITSDSIAILLPAILLTLLYPIKLSIFRYSISLRELPTFKLFIIAFVWSVVTVLLVANEHHILLSCEVLVLFLSRFFFVVAITIPFDIRDVKYDLPDMKTIPQRFGIDRAKMISLFFLALFEILTIVHFIFFDFHFSLLIGLLLCSMLSGFLIYKTEANSSDFHFSFWIEGLSLLMLILLFFIPTAFGIFAL